MESTAQMLPLAASVITLASVSLTIALGVILAFHWIRYAFAPAVTSIAILVYAVVSVVLLSGMFAPLVLSL